jgi:hypothetical protein
MLATVVLHSFRGQQYVYRQLREEAGVIKLKKERKRAHQACPPSRLRSILLASDTPRPSFPSPSHAAAESGLPCHRPSPSSSSPSRTIARAGWDISETFPRSCEKCAGPWRPGARSTSAATPEAMSVLLELAEGKPGLIDAAGLHRPHHQTCPNLPTDQSASPNE